MGTTADKLSKLLQTKQAIKQAIIDKGVDVSDDVKFADYPSKIESIESGGGGDPYYEYLWNACTNNNTDYSYLFEGYNGTELDVSKFDTSNVKDMSSMFHDCKSLTSLDLSHFNTSNATDMKEMFYGCYNLTSLDVSTFNTSNVTNMYYMFAFCNKLTSLDLSHFNTDKVTNMNYMFYGCEKLTSLNVNSWNISKVTTITATFQNCKSLTELNVSNWDIGHITASYYAGSTFNGCTSLVDFYPPQNINAPFEFNSSTALSHDSLMRIINNLMTVKSTKVLTLGKDNLAKLSDEEKAIATDKGWTLK